MDLNSHDIHIVMSNMHIATIMNPCLVWSICIFIFYRGSAIQPFEDPLIVTFSIARSTLIDVGTTTINSEESVANEDLIDVLGTTMINNEENVANEALIEVSTTMINSELPCYGTISSFNEKARFLQSQQ
jgi:hypothetical protein